MSEPESILIIGTGLIGSSIGMALTPRHTVFLKDALSSHALVAASLGAGVVDAPHDVSVVIVAVPPSLAAQVVVRALTDYPEAIVTDVASVKGVILDQLRAQGANSGLDLSRYVGSHPMAGTERSGPLTARGDLFNERTWVITPHESTAPDTIETVRQLAEECGARVVTMRPDEHDIAVAEVSHVPQIVSSLMAGNLTGVQPAHLRLAGPGVRDVTRIAGSQPGMWTQIITANKDAISTELRRLARTLDALVDHLESPEDVEAFMSKGVFGTKALPGKHGRRAEDYAHVVVEIPDSPGALGRLFADVGEAGVNVEDLAIEHDETREVGYMSIAVEPEKAAGLEQVMVTKGWVLKA
ncbi:MAG: prephenate dehydrogenase [Propionibacteriaceae bacterium]|nr:prephenate dehydrogenase [Propionibacteriaceae bacterium]